MTDQSKPRRSPMRGAKAYAEGMPAATRQERAFLALLGGCLGLTLLASAMLRLLGG